MEVSSRDDGFMHEGFIPERRFHMKVPYAREASYSMPGDTLKQAFTAKLQKKQPLKINANSGNTSLFVQRRPFQKKTTSENLTIIDKTTKALRKSMILVGRPATIQERPKRTWTSEVDAHEGHGGKTLEFLRFPVSAG